MNNSIIDLPGTFVASTTAVTAQLFSDLSPVLTLLFGVLLGTAVITILFKVFTN